MKNTNSKYLHNLYYHSDIYICFFIINKLYKDAHTHENAYFVQFSLNFLRKKQNAKQKRVTRHTEFHQSALSTNLLEKRK